MPCKNVLWIAISQSCFKVSFPHQFFKVSSFFHCIVINPLYSTRKDNKINILNFIQKMSSELHWIRNILKPHFSNDSLSTFFWFHCNPRIKKITEWTKKKLYKYERHSKSFISNSFLQKRHNKYSITCG